MSRLVSFLHPIPWIPALHFTSGSICTSNIPLGGGSLTICQKDQPSQVHTATPVFEKLKQENHELEASPGYRNPVCKTKKESNGIKYM